MPAEASINQRHSHEMADDAESDAHAAPARCRGTAMHGVASLAHLSEREIVEGLEDPHGYDGGGVAFEADVGLDPDEHLGTALMA